MPGLRHRALRGETSSTVLATSAATETPTARKASVLRPPSEANTANSQHGPHARLLLCSPGPAWRRWYPPPHCPHRAHGRPGSQGSQGSGAFLCATPPNSASSRLLPTGAGNTVCHVPSPSTRRARRPGLACAGPSSREARPKSAPFGRHRPPKPPLAARFPFCAPRTPCSHLIRALSTRCYRWQVMNLFTPKY